MPERIQLGSEAPRNFTKVGYDEKSRLYKPTNYKASTARNYEYRPPKKVSGGLYKPRQYEPNSFDPHKVHTVGKPREYDHLYEVFPVQKKEKKKDEPKPVKDPTPEPVKEKTPLPPPSPSPLPYNALPSIQRTFQSLLLHNKVAPVEMITDSFG